MRGALRTQPTPTGSNNEAQGRAAHRWVTVERTHTNLTEVVQSRNGMWNTFGVRLIAGLPT